MNNSVNIKRKISEIFKAKFNVDIDYKNEKLMQTELFSNDFRMPPRDLIYLLIEIEKEYGIAIPQEAIAEGRFNTINNIAKIIDEQLVLKKV